MHLHLEEDYNMDKFKIEDSHTVYEYIGAILAESLNLFEFKSTRQYKRDLNKTNLSPEDIAKRVNLRRKRIKAVTTDPNRTTKNPVINPPGGDPQGPRHTKTGKRIGHLTRAAQAARAKAKGERLPERPASKPLDPESSAEMADAIEKRNTNRSSRSSVTGRRRPGFGLRR